MSPAAPELVSAEQWEAARAALRGRHEQGEDSPSGGPQTPPYEWWRYHDEYE